MSGWTARYAVVWPGISGWRSGPGGEEQLEDAMLATLHSLPGRRAALRRAVAPLKKEAGQTAALAVQIAAGKRPLSPLGRWGRRGDFGGRGRTEQEKKRGGRDRESKEQR